MKEVVNYWGLQWYSKNKPEGTTIHLLYENCLPVMFKTKAKVKKYREDRYGYIKHRKDLRREPHGWRLPRIVKIKSIFYEENYTKLK